jgi:hypothetical protein
VNINSRSNSGGIISPIGMQLVGLRKSIAFSFKPDNEFHLEYLKGYSDNLTNFITTYTFKNVTANHNIFVQFENSSVEK